MYFSAGQTGSCFPDETTKGLQCVFRIPLPHQSIWEQTFLCAAIRTPELPNFTEGGHFYVSVSASLFPCLLERCCR